MREERLEGILEILSNTKQPVSGLELAEKLNVSRQMIVRDIATLRNAGHEILSTARGYLLKKHRSVKKLVAVAHGSANIMDELLTIVRNGGSVLDVIVEHPVYGELKGNIGVSTEEDVIRFISLLKGSSASPLLTVSKDGIHLHTIEAPDQKIMDTIIKNLDEKGYLLK